jgi:hypothetical protein
MAVLSSSSLIQHLKNNLLSDDWILKHRWNNVTNRQSSKLLVFNSIINASIEVLKESSLLLLTGEYIILPQDGLKQNFTDLQDFLTDRAQLIDINQDLVVQNEIQDFFYNNIVELVRNYIYLRLNNLDKDVKNQLLVEHKIKLLRLSKRSTVIYSDDKAFQEHRIIFSKILELTALEHFNYHLQETVISKLLMMKVEVEALTIVDFLKSATIAKIDFLQKKLFYRNKERDDRLGKLIYSSDLHPDVTLSLDNINADSKLAEWEEDINIHYGFSADYKKQQRQKVREIYEQYDLGNPITNFSNYRALVKKFKDDSKSTENIENLLRQFRRLSIPATSVVDTYAKRVTSSYLFNNNISLKLETVEMDYSGYKDIYYEIKDQQNVYDVKNYFPWKRLAVVIANKLDVLADNLARNDDFYAFKELLSLYGMVIQKLDESVRWCKKKSFVPLQFTFEECKSPYIIQTDRQGDLNLYCFTSIVLPLCYVTIEEEEEELKSKRIKYDAFYATYKKLRVVVAHVEETSQKLKNIERKSIEVLAIFSAISLFSIGSIQIFSNKSIAVDTGVYYKFIFSFGYTLILFALIIWIITRDNITKIHWFHWVLIGILMITSLFVIGYVVDAKFPL